MTKVEQKSHKHHTLIGRWSGRWAWVVRAQAWDDEQDRLYRATQAAAVRKMAEQHANIAATITDRLADRLRNLNPDTIPLGSLPHWLDVAVKVERLSRGEPDTIIGDRQSVEDLDAVDPELQALIDHALAQRAAEEAGSG